MGIDPPKIAKPQDRLRFAPPRLLDPLIPRQALLELAEKCKHRVGLLLGAPGSGKTFALVGFYNHYQTHGQEVHWLTLDASDNHPDHLNDHLTQAFLQPLRPEGVIFIDGGEKLTSLQAWANLEAFLLSLPAQVTAFVTAQTMRRSALYDGWLRGTVELIGPDLLQMTTEEASQILGPDFNEIEVDALTRFVQGWPAGLRFMSRDTLVARTITTQHSRPECPLPATMSSYFEDIVTARLSQSALDTLTQLAALERFAPAMLPAMPAPACDWAEVQALIHDQNYLRGLDAYKTWIGVQPAFGHYLRTRLKHQCLARYQELKEFAATWCAANGFPAEAVRHAAQMSDAKRAAEIIEQAGAIHVELGDGPDIDLSLDLPPQRARDLPLLFFSQVYHRIRHGRHRQARMAYDKAYEHTSGFTEVAPSADKFLVAAWAHMFKIILASIDDVPIANEDILKAEQFMLECLDQHPVLAASYASVIAWAYIENGDLLDANRICQMSFDPRDGESGIRVTLFAHVHWVSLVMMQDSVRTAVEHIEQAQTLAQIECGPDSYEVLIPQLKRGVLHYEQDQLLEARACLLPALARLRTVNGWLRIYAEALTTAVKVELGLNNIEGAYAQLRAGEQFAQIRNLPRLSAILAAERARLALFQNDLRSSRDILESTPLAEVLSYSGHDAYSLLPKAAALLAQAHLMLEIKRPRETLATLEDFGPILSVNPDARLRFSIHVLNMRACFELRRYNGAVEHMQAALDLAAFAGLTRRARENAAHLLTVYDWAVRNGKTISTRISDYVRNVLEHQAGEPTTRRALTDRATTSANNLALSPREAEIMTLVAEGLSAKEIALRLGISEGTVKSHRKKIHGKLGVSTRSQAIVKARELLII